MSREYSDAIDETTTDDGTTFRVVIEVDPESADLDPRHSDDFLTGVIVAHTSDSRYWRPQEDTDTVTADTIIAAIQDHSFPVVSRWLRIFHGASVVLPLYELLHGITTGDPTDTAPADGYSGVTFDTPTTRKVIGQATPDEMARMLTSDVDTWTEWARGDVYGWIIQRGNRDSEYGEIHEWEDEDSCWGFIGEDHARESARVALDDFTRAYDTDHPGNDEDDELQLAELASIRTL